MGESADDMVSKLSHNGVAQSEVIKNHYGAMKPAFQNNEPVKVGAMFKKVVLPTVKPVFHEYFLDNFPEPSAWLRARTMYARTYAVMTMVGYVLGYES